ncbi:MAG: 6,7-dimethyl-8-ribityllumazine synthase [Deltaproteobacteria bacterium]|nr:6,7-dimethyl-8-ribityllumazine synthase [Deltaproteobacteria bacterium]
MAQVIAGELSAAGIRFGIVAGRFNSFMTEHLVAGAVDTIVRHGGNSDHISIMYVPGSFEIPLACRKLAQSGTVDAIVTVGAVIRGSTSHYELVCGQLARGISQVALDEGLPVTFGVVTAENIEQAIERSGSKAGNKGSEAAIAAIEMVNLFKEMKKVK